jgi:hypothetical protein
VPLDTTVTLPTSTDRHLPFVVEINGFGNSKYEYLNPDSTAYTGNAFEWAKRGYAVLTYTARGLWGSCGTPESRAANPGPCATGYIHLADVRYEVRDAQYLTGLLVDQGYADQARIGVTGDSYGGGQSLDLATLRDRVMLPDGRLTPWLSPAGTPLHVAAAAPVIPWSDVVYAISPNGRTLTYDITPPAADAQPVGVQKATFSDGIYASAFVSTGPGQPIGQPQVPGRPFGYVAPPGLDPDADLTAWNSRSAAGEPYTDAASLATVETLQRFHSAYFLDHSEPPAPLLLQSGFTDDIFPVDETLRYVNRTRHQYPDAPISLMLADFGHQRGTNRAADHTRLLAAVHAWFDHYLRGGPAPAQGVSASTQTCPRTAASAGPFTAPTFAQLAHGEVRGSWHAPQSILSSGGNPTVAAALDPIAGGGDACARTPSDPEPGTASYSLPAAPASGYTLLGAPTILASLGVTQPAPGFAQIDGRLWDVSPDGSQTLVARGQYRPSGVGTEVWQLHANGWRFAAGHVAKLEALGSDAPFARPSNGSFQITVNNLELRLPVLDRPDCRVVLPALAPSVPPGATLAPGVAAALRSDGSRSSSSGAVVCSPSVVTVPCPRAPTLSFRIHQNNGRVTALRVYANGRLLRLVRGRRIASVHIRRPAAGAFTIRIVALTSNGRRVTSVRRYSGCSRKTKPHTRVGHRQRGHRRRQHRRREHRPQASPPALRWAPLSP